MCLVFCTCEPLVLGITCTSVPQEWHKPRGDSFEPEPDLKPDLKPNKTSFHFYSPDNSLLPPDQHPQEVLTFPKIPMLASCNQLFTLPEEFSDTTEPILQQININIEQAWHLQNDTVAQAQDKRWVQEREICLTASNCGKVLYRKTGTI